MSTGRFLSPDYSDSGSAPDPVPYADYTNPQSLNLYAYVHNNPLTLLDLSGHACDDDQGTITSDFSLDEGGGTTVDVSGQCYSTTAYLTQVQFNTQNPQTKAPTPAPSNGTPWYKSCTAQALAKGAGTTVLDAIGIIPEGGTISAAFSLWHGAAGVSNGIKIQQRVSFAGGLVSSIFATNELQGANGVDASSVVAGLQAVAGGAGVAKGLAEDIPVAGQVIAAGATALDLIGTGLEVAKCYP